MGFFPEKKGNKSQKNSQLTPRVLGISKLAKKFLGFHWFSSVSRFPETPKLGNPETHEDLVIYLKTITNLITT
jgi:hypothetical protein